MKIRAGIAVVAVLGCGAAAPLATASGASAATPKTGTGPAQNGPLAFSGTEATVGSTTPSGTGWIEANPDGSDGGGRREVVPSGAGIDPASPDTDVAFSHDGSKVAFVQHSDGTLWTANADGTGARRLVTPDTGFATVGPQWSSDGSTIYFSEDVTVAFGSSTPTILQVPAAGGAAKQILAKSDPDGDTQVTVSPDGTKIAYTTYDHTLDEQVVVVADATTHAKISTIPGATSPQYSPDGKVLAVVGWGYTTIVFYPPDGLASAGSKGQTVVDDLATSGRFAFSPDNTQLAYAGGNGQVRIRNLWNGTATDSGIAEQVVYGAISWQNGPLYTGRPSGVAATRPAAIRYGGADRIATSVVTADGSYGDPGSGMHAKVAVISRADTFADALAGNALAAQKGGPLMLTGSAKLDSRVAAELTKTLAPHSTVYLLGGTQALSPQVEADIAGLGFTPKRLAGTDRYGTAVRIAGEISAHPSAIMVATGTNFPDALAAGAAASANTGQIAGWSGVVVLTNGASMPAATKAYLSGFSPATTSIFGVGGAGVTAANSMPGYANHITDLSGNDRYETAAAVADERDLFGGLRNRSGSAESTNFEGLATGINWPDALSGGALVGALRGPLLLADANGIPTSELGPLHSRAPIVALAIFGGTSVVSNSIVTQAGNYAWGAGNWESVAG